MRAKEHATYIFDTCQSEIYCFHNHLSTKNNTILNINYQISNKDCSLSLRAYVPPVKCKYNSQSIYFFCCSFHSSLDLHFDDLACFCCIVLLLLLLSPNEPTEMLSHYVRKIVKGRIVFGLGLLY